MTTDLEQAVAVVRSALIQSQASRTDAEQQIVLIALELVASGSRSIDLLESEFSLFTLRDKGDVIVAVQDADCCRKFECRGANLREALCAAAHCSQLERRADEVEHG
jgi:hypothetical protein